jgi:phosphatidylglycerophosphate synthase
VPATVFRAADFLAAGKGGGLYSEAVSQRAGSVIAARAAGAGLTPNALTLGNLVCGVAASVVVIAAPTRWAGLVALIGWQLAYAFDCADGQLARTTGRASPAGARLDVLCDVAVQTAIVAALSTVALAQRPSTPAWLVAAFAGTWLVNLVTSALPKVSLVPSQVRAVRLVKLVRDFGAVVLVCGVVLAVAPQWTPALLWLGTVGNGAFLAASIVGASRG